MAASYSSGWTWCHRCQVLFSGPPNGACPAGGAHDGSTSASYFMLHIEHNTAGPNQQAEWRLCRKCRGLFFGPGAASSSCSAGGHHRIDGSSNFAVQVDDGKTPSNQQGWRSCKKCQTLFYGGNASPRPCPAGAAHDPSTSWHYNLPFVGVPWIGTYAFDGGLRVQGSNYTRGGQVDVLTMLSNGRQHHVERVTAIENQAAPGGWITAATNSLSSPGRPGQYNGYVQAHDLKSNKWSPKLPIVISQRID